MMLLTATLLSGWLAVSVQAHATLNMPAARNVLATVPENMDNDWANVEYCPHCKNLGGIDTVFDDPALAWPEGNRFPKGMCGDPYNVRGRPSYLAGGSKYNILWRNRKWGGVYREGQVFKTQVQFYTYHRGTIEMRLCVIDDWTFRKERRLTNDCFENGYKLKQAGRMARAAGQARSAIQYLPNGGFDGTDGNGLHAEAWEGIVESTWKLPKGVTCNFYGDRKKCILRMYYLTGNSCKRPNTPPKFQQYLVHELGECGAPGVAHPEEFYNCADIRIRPRRVAPTSGPGALASPGAPEPLQGLKPVEVSQQVVLPPDSPLLTCANASTLGCFCKSRGGSIDGVGYAANPWDASGSSYLGCDLAGRTLAWQCPAGTAFDDEANSCRVDGAPAAAAQGFRCYPGSRFALKKDPAGGDLQCWSKDMRACARVCGADASAAGAPFSPPAPGTLTCGAVLERLSGTTGYERKKHWCAKGCKAVGGCPAA